MQKKVKDGGFKKVPKHLSSESGNNLTGILQVNKNPKFPIVLKTMGTVVPILICLYGTQPGSII